MNDMVLRVAVRSMIILRILIVLLRNNPICVDLYWCEMGNFFKVLFGGGTTTNHGLKPVAAMRSFGQVFFRCLFFAAIGCFWAHCECGSRLAEGDKRSALGLDALASNGACCVVAKIYCGLALFGFLRLFLLDRLGFVTIA